MPSHPDNTSNANGRDFRGVDGYAPVNELYVRFEYRGYEDHPAEWRIVFVATVFAEFWNPFDREVRLGGAKLKFRFVEPIGFKANARVHRIEEAHLDRDEPFETGASFAVAPNGHHVQCFGELRLKVPVPKAGSGPMAFPVVQDLRAALSNRADTRAHYELWLDGRPVDSSGRRGSAESVDYGFFFPRHEPFLTPGSYFLRLAPGNGAVLGYGFNAGNGSHLGDPWMGYYSRSTIESAPYRFKASPGARNYDRDKVKSSRPDWFKDQTRVRAWPDRGYDTSARPGPTSDTMPPDSPAFRFVPEPAFAPWRLSQLGVFHSVTELGHLHDPAMWTYGPPAGADSVLARQSTQRYDRLRDTWLRGIREDAAASAIWGGGNTLRIGRPEHPRFDRPGMRASQWLDLFHTGFAGTNLGPVDPAEAARLYRHHDPGDHQPPPAAPDPAAATGEPYALLYDPVLHAQGDYQLVHGQLNLNTAPTRFEIETLLRGPSASSDLRLASDHFATPAYDREGDTGILRSALNEAAIPRVAEGLMRVRPFYSPSHLARVFSELLERHGALPDHHNDAEAEEPFARLSNATTFSSRHFRIHTAAEVYHRETGEVVGRARRVHEVFLRPVRDARGAIERVVAETVSTREL